MEPPKDYPEIDDNIPWKPAWIEVAAVATVVVVIAVIWKFL